jgi:hypothetical protein
MEFNTDTNNDLIQQRILALQKTTCNSHGLQVATVCTESSCIKNNQLQLCDNCINEHPNNHVTLPVEKLFHTNLIEGYKSVNGIIDENPSPSLILSIDELLSKLQNNTVEIIKNAHTKLKDVILRKVTKDYQVAKQDYEKLLKNCFMDEKSIGTILNENPEFVEFHKKLGDEKDIKAALIKQVETETIAELNNLTTSILSKEAGLVNDIISNYERSTTASLSISPTITALFKNLDDITFNIFDAKNLSQGHELQLILLDIFNSNNFFNELNINRETFNSFINRVAAGYQDTPYHCNTHAADVTQCSYYFLQKCEFKTIAGLTAFEQAAVYIASAVHDIDHPGTNNVYQINTKSLYAITYNDKAVLENHHISVASQILLQDKYNIFKNFTVEQQKKMREYLIAMVLATDMAGHFVLINTIKGKITESGNKIAEADRLKHMEMIVHASDISNPAKPFEIYKDWAARILIEFFNQGDKEYEAGLPITILCDRYTTNTSKSQLGFINFIVAPTFQTLQQLMPKLDLTHLNRNIEQWNSLTEHYDEELKKLNANGGRPKKLQ